MKPFIKTAWIVMISLTIVALSGAAYGKGLEPALNYSRVLMDSNMGVTIQTYNLSCPQPNISLSCPACNMTGTNVICNNQNSDVTYPLFMEEAKNVAGAHHYEKGRFVCQDFARELVRRLRSDGYEAYYCIGIAKWCVAGNEGNERNCWHAWVKLGEGLYIEATTGDFIEPKDYRRDYDERRCY